MFFNKECIYYGILTAVQTLILLFTSVLGIFEIKIILDVFVSCYLVIIFFLLIIS